MKLGERIAAIDRLQKTRLFKLIATAVVILGGLSAFITYAVAQKASAPRIEIQEEAPPPQPAPASGTETSANKNSPVVQNKVGGAEDANAKAAVRAINAILARKADPTSVGVTIAATGLFALLVIWLGVGLWYLFLWTGLALVFYIGRIAPQWGSWVTFVGGAGGLWAIFLALISAVRVLLSAPHPVFSIARNTLDQAVRMKVSVVFVVLLVLLLAALPLLLDPQQALRYRVQSFLQYGTGLSYTIIAALTVLFSVYTVATEQRDRVIWQTVTKPVAAWQYVIGKWLGVVSLSAVLLCVTGGAVFLFTEYLRGTPAQGEREAYITKDMQGAPITPDRRILETQILTARVSFEISPPILDEKAFNENVEAKIKAEQAHRPDFGRTEEDRQFVAEDLKKAIMMEYRTIAPGQDRVYTFTGLKEAKNKNLPVILRYRPESGSNRPDLLYSLTFLFPANGSSVVEKAALAQAHSIALTPAVIDDNGELKVSVVNGDFFNRVPNGGSVYFSHDALEVSYSSGSYYFNFARVFFVLWLKTAFVAMAGVFASTFLSFSVATLAAFGIFLVAESSRFITDALENWNVTDNMGHDVFFYLLVDKVASFISTPLRFYADLKPTQHLVDGVLLPWSSVATGTTLLALLVMILFALAALIFRSRELAVYSGN